MEPSLPAPASPARQFWRGVRAILPILLGVIPFGVIYGVLARQAGMPVPAAQSMSFIVFAGSSQFIAAQLIHAAAPALVIVLAIFVVNLRHALYSASIAGFIQGLPTAWKVVLAYVLTDEAYAVAITNYQREGNLGNQHYYFLGCGLSLWAAWQISTAAGILLGVAAPSSLPLDFALPLTFIALLVPALKDRAGVAAALVAGCLALVTFNLPYQLGILVAALAGIGAGLLVERKR